MAGKTLYDKLWESHVVREESDGTCLLYIDRHLMHEVTSPQAFEGLRLTGRKPWRASSVVATADHNTPTDHWDDADSGLKDPISRLQIETLDANIKDFGALVYFPFKHANQGIIHVIGPENGATLPGMTVVCGDSHTSTHGAFGALAHGIGTSEVEHVLATQTLVAKKSKRMLIKVEGKLGAGVTAKDIALAIIGKIGTAGGTGYAIEFGGSAIRDLSMEGRMTVCNLAIEGGARAGLVAPDEKTFEYLKGRPLAPKGADWDKAVAYWKTLTTDADAKFDAVVELDAAKIQPQVTWGTSPEQVLAVGAKVPNPANPEYAGDAQKRAGIERALKYMGLAADTPISEIKVDKVFIGSCTNSRIEDLRAAAAVAKGKQKAASVKLVLVVPGSGIVKRQAEEEGLDKVFTAAGFEWREPGCSMCLAMNADRLEPGERCASTSNRNFEGRQGAGGRTHLVSPAMAAAAAIAGHFVPHPELLTMKPFTSLDGLVCPLDRANVNTDAIIPKQFLKSIKRSGFGPYLFNEWRYSDTGQPGMDCTNRPLKKDFVLNQPRYKKSQILLARDNFGCGSSREHAPWAIEDYGFRVIIAPSFADIFFGNCYKNGVLPIVASAEIVDQLFRECAAQKGYKLTVDLETQTVRNPAGEWFTFDITPHRKHCLLNGLDEIGLTLQHADEIKAFEAKHKAAQPWLFAN